MAQASAFGIVGPDVLAEIAHQILGGAMVINAVIMVPGTAAAADVAQREVDRLTQEFENEARTLLRPTPRQKNGRNLLASAA
jgi:hypothetical protein